MAPPPLSPAAAAARIHATRRDFDPARALLVGLSGIDGSGKGWMAAALAASLRDAGLNVATLNVDGWLNLPAVRISERDLAEHFYAHALRLDAFVRDLLQPLRATRAVDLWMDYAEETATTFRRHHYRYDDVDVILAEGIFLFKRAYRGVFDLALWVDCSFATALGRALARAQEGLSPAATVRAYETIYFPAQRIHFERDMPQAGVDARIPNDPRLAARDLELTSATA
jgi:uridine kinase